MPYADFNAKIITGSKVAATGTFVEEKITMPDLKRRGIVPAIVGFEFTIPDFHALADKYAQVALTTKSNDAMPDLDDSEVILWHKIFSADAATTNTQDGIVRINLPAPIPLSNTEIYFQGIQDSGGNHTFAYRILWVPRNIPGAVQQEAQLQSCQF